MTVFSSERFARAVERLTMYRYADIVSRYIGEVRKEDYCAFSVHVWDRVAAPVTATLLARRLERRGHYVEGWNA